MTYAKLKLSHSLLFFPHFLNLPLQYLPFISTCNQLYVMDSKASIHCLYTQCLQCTQNLNGLSITFYCLQSKHTILVSCHNDDAKYPQYGACSGLPQLFYWTHHEYHICIYMNLKVCHTTYVYTYLHMPTYALTSMCSTAHFKT